MPPEEQGDVSFEDKEVILQNRLCMLRQLEEQYADDEAEPVVAEKVEIAGMCSGMALEVLNGPGPPAHFDQARRLGEAAALLLRGGTIPSTKAVIKGRASAQAALACYYDKVNRKKAALLCAQKAATLVRQYGETSESAVTVFLSLAALCCANQRHADGLSAANSALNACLALEEGASEMRYPTLQAMCLYNVAACHEQLGSLSHALQSYRKAFHLGYLSVGEGHPLCEKFREGFADAYTKAHGKKVKDNLRAIVRASRRANTPVASLLMPTSLRPVSVSPALSRRYSLGPTDKVPRPASADQTSPLPRTLPVTRQPWVHSCMPTPGKLSNTMRVPCKVYDTSG